MPEAMRTQAVRAEPPLHQKMLSRVRAVPVRGGQDDSTLPARAEHALLRRPLHRGVQESVHGRPGVRAQVQRNMWGLQKERASRHTVPDQGAFIKH
jgi:hypothetical protein